VSQTLYSSTLVQLLESTIPITTCSLEVKSDIKIIITKSRFNSSSPSSLYRALCHQLQARQVTSRKAARQMHKLLAMLLTMPIRSPCRRQATRSNPSHNRCITPSSRCQEAAVQARDPRAAIRCTQHSLCTKISCPLSLSLTSTIQSRCSSKALTNTNNTNCSSSFSSSNSSSTTREQRVALQTITMRMQSTSNLSIIKNTKIGSLLVEQESDRTGDQYVQKPHL